MKEKLMKLLEAKNEQRNNLNKALIESDNKEERAEIGKTLEALAAEIEEVKEMIAELDDPADEPEAQPDEANSENKNGEERGMNVMSTMNFNKEPEKIKDRYDTEEYRKAFMEFACRGKAIPAELRGDEVTKTSDVGAVIPTTILNEIVMELKSYGSLFAAARKLNVQGGVQIPVLSLKPTATWITADTATSESDKQKLATGTSISFSYHGLECKISQTLLVNVTTLEMFQELFVPLAVEAIAKALDVAIMNGTGNGQPTGITVDTRVPNGNKITLTPDEIESWADWKKKVFGKMAKSYRDGTFYMAQSTFDGYIDGMVDSNGQPIGRVNYGIDGAETYRFGGKNVETVEEDVIKGYETASTGDVIAVFVKMSDYAINSNMELQTVKWVDHDTNEVKNKCIMICDGKLVDANGVLLIKKGAASN